MNSEEKYDSLIDWCLPEMDLCQRREQLEDIMYQGERVDIDVEAIPDCDSREDFIELNQLSRVHDNFTRDEFNLINY